MTTLEAILRLVERKYGEARRVWVFDRGIDNRPTRDPTSQNHYSDTQQETLLAHLGMHLPERIDFDYECSANSEVG